MSTRADNVSAFCDVVQGVALVWGFLTERADYIFKFDDNLEKLTTALGDLIAKRDDLIRTVNVEEIKSRRRLDQIERWRLKVQAVAVNANLVVADASVVQQSVSRCGYCSINIFSAYSSGKKILKVLSDVEKLRPITFPEGLTQQATLPRVIEEPVPETVGLVTTLEKTWESLMKDNVKLLGIHGTAGVGKTTLLALINNKFRDNEDFDVVVWVKVSKDVDISKIQDEIGKRLGPLYDENWSQKSEREKRYAIGRVLKKTTRFVLLLDDLWDVVSLADIGISLRGEFKIVFTTRNKDICVRMEANEVIEVERLGVKDALDLLKKKARRDTLDGQMLEHATNIVGKCLGLPLVLGVIGKFLSSKTTADEWHNVLCTWFRGMENEIFSVLKYSYDTLDKDDTRSCFKYCALFPEACKIREDELVEYWIGEGILNEEDGREIATDRGYTIIDTLVGADLLVVDGEPKQKVYMHGLIRESKQKVYMHGLIREMALRIVVEGGERFVVKTGAGLSKLPKIKNWKTVTKMSLMNNEIKSIADDSQFPNPDRLVTLFFQNNKLEGIVGKFFQVLSTLVVLDLSHNIGITELPDISKLVFLRYLNLLGTMIKSLQGLKDLTELIHLDLESTVNLKNIDLISGLQYLQVLRFYCSAPLDFPLLQNLGSLEELKLVTITVENKIEVLEAFLRSKVAGCTQGLYLDKLEVSGVSGKSFAATFGELGSLSKLGMTECNIIESATEWEENRSHQCSHPSNQASPRNIWFENLSAVVIYLCVSLTDLTWLIYAENLESLSVKISPNMEEVISKEKAADFGVEPFQKLKVLDLDYLDTLKSIYWRPLSFPLLQKVHITNCPDLPLNSVSVKKMDDLLTKRY